MAPTTSPAATPVGGRPRYYVLDDTAPARLVAEVRDARFRRFARRLGCRPRDLVPGRPEAWRDHYPLTARQARLALARGAERATGAQWARWSRAQTEYVGSLWLRGARERDGEVPALPRHPELFAAPAG